VVIEKRIIFASMNSKNSILLVDPDFDPNTAGDCDLLIKVSTDNFSYAIIDKSCNQLRAVYDQQECTDTVKDLADQLKNDHYLQLPFRKVKGSFFTENCVAVPDEIFDEQDIGQYTRYFNEYQNHNLYAQPFEDYGFTSVFNLSTRIEEVLRSLPESKRYDHGAPLLALSKGNSIQILQLDFTVGSFNVTYLNAEQLIFQKYFEIENAEEFNYYLLLMINQLKIETGKTEVHLSGIIHQDDAKYLCVTKYFNTVHFNEAKGHELNTRILDDMPSHYYTSLLALDLCV